MYGAISNKGICELLYVLMIQFASPTAWHHNKNHQGWQFWDDFSELTLVAPILTGVLVHFFAKLQMSDHRSGRQKDLEHP